MKKSAKKITHATRYQFWREAGIAIQDAPLRYATGKELDRYTDQCIRTVKRVEPSIRAFAPKRVSRVKCIKRSMDTFTFGKAYRVKGVKPDDYLMTDDYGTDHWHAKKYFEPEE